MTDSDEQGLREKNNEMAQAIQYWKMTATQKESEKFQLLKEVNELRLQVSSLRNAESSRARKLNVELQTASEEALAHLVQASSVVARMLEHVKSYMLERQEKESVLPRLSNTPTAEKVNRVPPMLIGGRHIQPVVSLSRTLQPYNSIPSRSPNQNNRSVPARAMPMHMLQDLIIPLTRIDAERSVSQGEENVEENMADDSMENLASDDSSEQLEEFSAREDFEDLPSRLNPVPEEEMETEHTTPSRTMMENPLEGPSWLLDASPNNTERQSKNPTKSEPDSTTELHENEPSPVQSPNNLQMETQPVSVEFTPTVRRRRRVSPPPDPHSPPGSPRPARRTDSDSNNGRILKVLVAKMRFTDDEDDDDNAVATPPKRPKKVTSKKHAKRPSPDDIPPKKLNPKKKTQPQKISQRRSPYTPERRESAAAVRPAADGSPTCPGRDLTPSRRLMRFDAPSPNGSTDARVIVLETRHDQPEPCCSGVSKLRRFSRANSSENRQQKHSNHVHNNSNHVHNNSNHNNHRADSRDNHDDTPTSELSHSSDNNHSSGNSHSSGNNHSNRDDHNHTSRTTNFNHDSANHVRGRRKVRSNRGRLNSENDNFVDSDSSNHTSNTTNSNHDSSRLVNGSRTRNDNVTNDIDTDSSNSDIREGRTRRPRKAVIYKEKPLNRKMRR